MDNIITSIDLGTSKICVLIGQVDNNQLHVLGLGKSESNGIKKGVVVDIEAAAKDIARAVEQAENMANVEIESVYINIPGGYSKLLNNKGVIAISGDNSEIDIEDVNRVLNSATIVSIPQGEQIIDIIPNQYIVDGYDEIKDPIGMSGIRLEVDANIVTSSSTTSLNLIKSVNKAGLEVLGIVMEPLALSEAIITKDEMELGVCIVDIGAGNSDVSIFKGNKLIYSSAIQVAGNHITNDISIGLRMPFDNSEEIKKHYGITYTPSADDEKCFDIKPIGRDEEISVSQLQLAEIIEARVSEIFELVNQQLVRSHLKNSILAGIVITGGGVSYLDGVLDLAKDIFDLPVRIGRPAYLGVEEPIFSTSVGLINYSFKRKFNYYVEYNNVDVKKNGYKGNMKKRKNNVVSTIKKIWDEYF
ncbi:cell division protein FtsA [Sporosalibacterium faouarense]|uniref:cell division protein FtsA n=1 Tax=Sporosalibacterium faouarense TaxID=516123 RepID=UPI00141C17F6|nr:cell division protein FtsA [Sporosalibacterium faouarense]MTI49036.1 cell division protein FtsA [Bacillota bacterium]